jgi:hypothetical protein
MIYHVLNGDALLSQFPQSIPGERIVFRECLVDGPVNPNPTQDFWQVREAFIQSYPNLEQVDYQKNSYQEILKIKSIPAVAKIYLWFEEDLFCQVNLWFVLNFLHAHPAEVYLILPYPDSPYHFSRLGAKDLEVSFSKKSHFLSLKEREVLGNLWFHFQNEEVAEALQVAQLFAERFPFLKLAVEAWRDMIPIGDFPGKPKAVLLELAAKNKTKDFEKIFRDFQKQLPEYGFGDLQVHSMCHELGII